jgi:hypothetical protein
MVRDFQEVAAAELPAQIDWLLSEESSSAQFDPQQWLGIVQLMTFKINYAARHGTQVDWSALSDAYSRGVELAERAGIVDRKEIAIRALNLTSSVVRAVGPDRRIALRNPTEAMRLFFETIPLSPAEARQLSTDWPTRDISEIRRLRVAKNLVRPAMMLKPFLEDAETRSKLADWEAVYPHLP